MKKVLLLLLIPLAQAGAIEKLTVYTAKKIITMEPAQPIARAVAVAEGKIVAVGSLDSLQSWMMGREVKIDRRFADKILLPGFIDPHVHPSLPAILTQFPFLAPDDWQLPTGSFPGAKNPKAFEQQLKALVAVQTESESGIPFIVFGYHQLWHGAVYRQQLDQWFPDRAVILWHRSFHELIANSAALDLLGLREDQLKDPRHINWQKGHFWENGAFELVARMGFLFEPQRYTNGLGNFLQMAHQGGVTTVLDMGVGIMGDTEAEINTIRQVVESTDTPVRVILTPIITSFLAKGKSPAQAKSLIEQWTAQNSEQVMLDKHFKLMLDGAIFSGLSQPGFPGYIDGHKGVWMVPLEVTQKWAQTFWQAGYQLHAHSNGAGSAAALIKLVKNLQQHQPRFDHRTTLEHFAYATEDQLKQMGELGMVVSANPYYQYILSDLYAEKWLGEDRARNMVPLATAVRHRVPVALHSDAPMAPLSPLTLVWTAVNRSTINGNQNNAAQKLTVQQALRAITIDAAWAMRWEDRIGSIRAGKIADFTVLEQDPLQVKPGKLKDIPVWGVVYEGRPYPVTN